MKVEITVPDGQSGIWKVETVVVPENCPSQVISMLQTGRGCVRGGTFKRLVRKGPEDIWDVVVMSNTPDEIRDCLPFVWKAKGSILVNGLGLGVVVKMLLEKPGVTDITVVEQSADVIKLSGPTYSGDPRLTIVHADAFRYQPPKGKRFNAVWHDIWDFITSDNLPEMAELHRRYGRRTDWQASWCRPQCERMRRQDKRDSLYVY